MPSSGALNSVILRNSRDFDADVLGWRRTWADDLMREDYALIDGGETVARAYLHETSGSGPYWLWSTLVVPSDRGSCPSRREALLAAEESYAKWRRHRDARSGPDGTARC